MLPLETRVIAPPSVLIPTVGEGAGEAETKLSPLTEPMVVAPVVVNATPLVVLVPGLATEAATVPTDTELVSVMAPLLLLVARAFRLPAVIEPPVCPMLPLAPMRRIPVPALTAAPKDMPPSPPDSKLISPLLLVMAPLVDVVSDVPAVTGVPTTAAATSAILPPRLVTASLMLRLLSD